MQNSPREGIYIISQKISRWQPQKVRIDLPVNG